MGLFDSFKKKNNASMLANIPINPNLIYPIADFQWDFVNEEINRINTLLQTNIYTQHLYFDYSILEKERCYFRFIPFTEKTRKISKYPCILDINSFPASYSSESQYITFYGASLYYDTSDALGKGQIFVHTHQYGYTIDIKNTENQLLITKVIATDKNLENHKIFHIQKNGSVFTASN